MTETDPKATAYLLLETLTDFQRSLHETDGEDELDVVSSDSSIIVMNPRWLMPRYHNMGRHGAERGAVSHDGASVPRWDIRGHTGVGTSDSMRSHR